LLAQKPGYDPEYSVVSGSGNTKVLLPGKGECELESLRKSLRSWGMPRKPQGSNLVEETPQVIRRDPERGEKEKKLNTAFLRLSILMGEAK